MDIRLELINLSGHKKRGSHDHGQEWKGSCRGPEAPRPFCFSLPANGWFQVQLEIQKKWRQWHLRELPLRPVALTSSFSNGTSVLTHGTTVSPTELRRGTCRASVI